MASLRPSLGCGRTVGNPAERHGGHGCRHDRALAGVRALLQAKGIRPRCAAYHGRMSTLPHTPGYSRRSHEIAPFHVMSLLARAQALEQAGHDVIHLEIGEPDCTTAEPGVRAGQAALAAGHTR